MHVDPRTLFLIGLATAAGCADEGSGEEAAPEGTPAETVVDARAPTRDASRDARTSTLDASRPRPTPVRECTPGRYAGEFNCLISGLLPWFGKIEFALVETGSSAGEFSTLDVAAGTRIAGTDDSLSGMFSADLNGSFDCRTGTLTGRIENGVYIFAGAMEYQLEGPLEGTYLSDGGTPGFTGTMGKLTSANFELFGDFGPSAMCTWHAERAGDGPDAGR